jgi:hypothetical protein
MHTALYGVYTVVLIVVVISIISNKFPAALYRGGGFEDSVGLKENCVGPRVAAKNYAPFVADLLFGAHGACGAIGGFWRSREAYPKGSPRDGREGGESMKRVLTGIVAMLIMAAMLVAMAIPAFAATPACREADDKKFESCERGNLLVTDKNNPKHDSQVKLTGQP